MAQPFVGEIRIFAGNFAPAGWLFCEGQLVPIAENDTLFNLIGTTYGGDGQETFALPDMRGRLMVHQGSGYILAQTGGVEEVTLSVNQIPNHTHLVTVNNAPGNVGSPAQAVLAAAGPTGTSLKAYVPYGTATQVTLPANAVASVGGSQPHSNMQPYLCLNYIISQFGIFPST